MNDRLAAAFERMPVVAILRGVQPDEVAGIGNALERAGIGIIEVPLNSPQPCRSITILRQQLAAECIVGAGTVLTPMQVEEVAAAGGEIIVSPNTDEQVILSSIRSGLTPMPGWATASDAFTAYAAGARYLKLFPAATYGPGHVKALSAVLPSDSRLLAVGGVGASVAAQWLQAGVHGFGIGTELYKPGDSAEQVYRAAVTVVAAIRNALASQR